MEAATQPAAQNLRCSEGGERPGRERRRGRTTRRPVVAEREQARRRPPACAGRQAVSLRCAPRLARCPPCGRRGSRAACARLAVRRSPDDRHAPPAAAAPTTGTRGGRTRPRVRGQLAERRPCAAASGSAGSATSNKEICVPVVLSLGRGLLADAEQPPVAHGMEVRRVAGDLQLAGSPAASPDPRGPLCTVDRSGGT